MSTYNREAIEAQAPMLLTEDMILSPQEQVQTFWGRLPETAGDKAILHSILKEWITGCYDADLALRWVLLLTLTEPPTGVNAYEVMHRLARREFGAVRFPGRTQDKEAEA